MPSDSRARSCRVVVIDDNYDDVRTTALYLQSMGHKVDYAINGYAGLDVAMRFRPDVVFFEYPATIRRMAGQSGGAPGFACNRGTAWRIIA